MSRAAEKKRHSSKKPRGPAYYGISLQFNVKKFLTDYHTQHPELDATFFNQLSNTNRIPSGHHVTLVHSSSLRGEKKTSKEHALWDKYVGLCKGGGSGPEVDVYVSKLVHNSKIMALVVKQIVPSDIVSTNKVPHITVGTIDGSVKPFHSNDMLEKVFSEEGSSSSGEVIVHFDPELHIKGVVNGHY